MVLLGIVPELMHVPPTTSRFSIRATRFPDLAPCMAARCPAGPEPMTIRSYCCIAGLGAHPILTRWPRGAGAGLARRGQGSGAATHSQESTPMHKRVVARTV